VRTGSPSRRLFLIGHRAVAQKGEHVIANHEAAGSIPVRPHSPELTRAHTKAGPPNRLRHPKGHEEAVSPRKSQGRGSAPTGHKRPTASSRSRGVPPSQHRVNDRNGETLKPAPALKANRCRPYESATTLSRHRWECVGRWCRAARRLSPARRPANHFVTEARAVSGDSRQGRLVLLGWGR
jgi:hypothetical protein